MSAPTSRVDFWKREHDECGALHDILLRAVERVARLPFGSTEARTVAEAAIAEHAALSDAFDDRRRKEEADEAKADREAA